MEQYRNIEVECDEDHKFKLEIPEDDRRRLPSSDEGYASLFAEDGDGAGDADDADDDIAIDDADMGDDDLLKDFMDALNADGDDEGDFEDEEAFDGEDDFVPDENSDKE